MLNLFQMGRTNGKLTRFLKDALLNDSFCNLKWQDKNSQIFTLKLPRYEKRKDLTNYEKILNVSLLLYLTVSYYHYLIVSVTFLIIKLVSAVLLKSF